MEKMTFETAIKRLEEITLLIEKGELTLDDSIKLYEEGVKLTGVCENMLDTAQLKLTTQKSGEENGD